MNLTTVAVPNLIAHDLVIVHPMSSMAGYVTYIEYSYSTAKGTTKPDAEGNFPVINSPFALGNVDADYTSYRVVEEIAEGQTELAWDVVTDGKGNDLVEKFTDGKWVAVEGKYTPVAGDKVRYVYNNIVVPQEKLPTIKAEMKIITF